MADLHAIEPEPLGDAVIQMLEKALEMARNGEISSAGIAMVLRDGCTHQLWSEAPSVGLLMGSVGRLHHKLNLELDE